MSEAAPVRGRRLAPTERRAALIELGKQLFTSHAYDDLSIDDVARLGGVSKGLLYHYFESKRGFYVATIRQLGEELLEAMRLDTDEELDDALRRVLQAFYAFLTDNGRLFRTLVRGGIGNDPEVARIVDDVRDRMLRRLAQRLGLDQPSPDLRVRLVAWLGAVEALAVDRVDHGDVSEADFIAISLDVLAGLVSRHSSAYDGA